MTILLEQTISEISDFLVTENQKLVSYSNQEEYEKAYEVRNKIDLIIYDTSILLSTLSNIDATKWKNKLESQDNYIREELYKTYQK